MNKLAVAPAASMLFFFLLLLGGMANATCPLAGYVKIDATDSNLYGGHGQYPTNLIDTVANANPDENVATTVWTTPEFSAPSNCTADEYNSFASEVVDFVKQGTVKPATITRMAFHTCGTWSQSAQNGGCSGAWHNYYNDASFPGNEGIQPALDGIKSIKERYPCLTLADAWTFSGVVAQEWAGGPAVAWIPGRLDALSPGPTAPPFAARLPDGMFNAAGVQYNFLQYGMTEREIVALISGGHSFGGANVATTGWNGSFTPAGNSWPTPKNRYLRDMNDLEWVATTVPESGRLQLVPAPGQNTQYTDASGNLVFRLPSDLALVESDYFGPWAAAYAANETLFLSDYSRIFQRTLQLGAGITWEPLAADGDYKWRGLNGDWEGWGPYMDPQLDSVDVPPLVEEVYAADEAMVLSGKLTDMTYDSPINTRQTCDVQGAASTSG